MAEVRVLAIEGEPWFAAKDVCQVLGYTDGRKAVRDYVLPGQKGGFKMEHPTSKSGFAEVSIINEPGLYRLIMRSKVEGAERFQDWVTAEVLPTIRTERHLMTLRFSSSHALRAADKAAPIAADALPPSGRTLA
ncbi:BRO-N domain-containing protein [Saccharopolyspora sp. NPDC000995]